VDADLRKKNTKKMLENKGNRAFFVITEIIQWGDYGKCFRVQYFYQAGFFSSNFQTLIPFCNFTQSESFFLLFCSCHLILLFNWEYSQLNENVTEG
jgi:hypothetical protein